MKTLCLILVLVAAPMCHAADEAVVFQYPPTVDSLMRVWGTLFECAKQAGVEPYDIHVGQLSDTGMLLKIHPSKFAPFVLAATTLIGEPLLEYKKLAEETTTFATFSIVLTWPDQGQQTALDEQLKLLAQQGAKVEKPTMQVVLVAAGEPIMEDLIKLMEAKRNANPPK